jgi:hypothetical protein
MDRVGISVVAVAIAAFVIGFGASRALDGPIVETGRADVQEGGGGSISTDDWTYGFAPGVEWTDENGVRNDDTPPSCLVPGESVNVTFAATEVTVEGLTWRPVVWVDCRTATPFP